MRLARLIQTNMEHLLEDWEDAVLEIAPELSGEDHLGLRGHARSMLEFICQDLVTTQTESESASEALGQGKDSVLDIGGQHGVHRHRQGSPFALLFIDLDHFKQANNQIGHEVGDRLLAQVAKRIGSSVRAVDTLARFGGDEFTLILKDTGREGAKEAARAFVTSLERAFDVDSHQVNISGSIVLTLYPEDGMSVSQLMHNADQAMYTAKKNGGQQVQTYESWMAESESEHMRLNRELDDALKENQLEVYYQPIIDIRTGAISKAEALLRWNHLRKGLLTPNAFLSITKHSGMTGQVTAFVVEQAVTCSLLWRDLHDQAFPININESPASFVTRSLVDQWRA